MRERRRASDGDQASGLISLVFGSWSIIWQLPPLKDANGFSVFNFLSFLTQLLAERSRSVNDQGGNGKEEKEALRQARKQVGGIGKPTAGNVGSLCGCFVLFCMYSNTLPLPGVFWDESGRGFV